MRSPRWYYAFQGATNAMLLSTAIMVACMLPPVTSQSSGVSPCTVCPNGEPITLPEQPLNLGEAFSFVDNCGTLEAVIGMVAAGSPECSLIQSASSLCGCPIRDDACFLCVEGGSVSLPNEDLSWILGSRLGTGSILPSGIVPTCGLVEAVAKSYSQGSQECRDVQFISGLCGCPPLQQVEACVFCPNDPSGLSRPDKPVEIASTVLDAVPTCGQLENVVLQFSSTKEECTLAVFINYICGCNGGQRDYLGATNEQQKRALAWVPRISALLSVLGSSLILWDILRDKVKRKSIYHTLMVSISVFDIFGSVAWGLTTWPVPEYDEYGEPTLVYGARGTEQTCTAQGFFIQLGFVSMFYNMSLSFYYLLMIRYSMREAQIKRYLKWLLLPPFVVGLALACAGIPFYENDLWGCYIAPPPWGDDYVNIVVFAVLPICIAILTVTVNMVLVYAAVRHQAAKANKWIMSRGNLNTEANHANSPQASPNTLTVSNPSSPDSVVWSRLKVSAKSSGTPRTQMRQSQKSNTKSAIEKMERQTFWQAVAYLAVFYLTWPILLGSNLSEDVTYRYPYMVVVFILAPLQGFLNFLVYARPRFLKYNKTRLRDNKRLKDKRDISDNQEDVTGEDNTSTGPLEEFKKVEEEKVEEFDVHEMHVDDEEEK